MIRKPFYDHIHKHRMQAGRAHFGPASVTKEAI